MPKIPGSFTPKGDSVTLGFLRLAYASGGTGLQTRPYRPLGCEAAPVLGLGQTPSPPVASPSHPRRVAGHLRRFPGAADRGDTQFGGRRAGIPLLVTIFDDPKRRTVLAFQCWKIRARRRVLTVELAARRTPRRGALMASKPLLSYDDVLRRFGERYASRQSSSSSRFCWRSYLGSHDLLSAPLRTQGARM
jgi:hypothetical protein